MSQGYRVAVVGATGQVGTLMLRLLRERGFPAREIVPFASERSAGRDLPGVGTVTALRADTIVMESAATIVLPGPWVVARERRYGGTLVTVAHRSADNS